eukprot:1158461-Pelagomonas_calceolata.AAC.5
MVSADPYGMYRPFDGECQSIWHYGPFDGDHQQGPLSMPLMVGMHPENSAPHTQLHTNTRVPYSSEHRHMCMHAFRTPLSWTQVTVVTAKECYCLAWLCLHQRTCACTHVVFP